MSKTIKVLTRAARLAARARRDVREVLAKAVVVVLLPLDIVLGGKSDG